MFEKNFTLIPNEFFDSYLAQLSDDGCKVYCALQRIVDLNIDLIPIKNIAYIERLTKLSKKRIESAIQELYDLNVLNADITGF